MIVFINIIPTDEGFKIQPDSPDMPTTLIGFETIAKTQDIIENVMFSASIWKLKKVSELKYQIID